MIRPTSSPNLKKRQRPTFSLKSAKCKWSKRCVFRSGRFRLFAHNLRFFLSRASLSFSSSSFSSSSVPSSSVSSSSVPLSYFSFSSFLSSYGFCYFIPLFLLLYHWVISFPISWSEMLKGVTVSWPYYCLNQSTIYSFNLSYALIVFTLPTLVLQNSFS